MFTIAMTILGLLFGGVFMHLYHKDELKKKVNVLSEMMTAKKYRAVPVSGSIVSNTGIVYVRGLKDRTILEKGVELRNAVYKEAIEDALIIFE